MHSYIDCAFVTEHECSFVEALTSSTTGVTLGYIFGGAKIGPNALVAGDARLIDEVFRRLIMLPTLPWLRGKLFLIKLDRIELATERDIRQLLQNVIIDALVMLPDTTPPNRSSDCGYWTTLRLCRKLGMIDGRGVN